MPRSQLRNQLIGTALRLRSADEAERAQNQQDADRRAREEEKERQRRARERNLARLRGVTKKELLDQIDQGSSAEQVITADREQKAAIKTESEREQTATEQKQLMGVGRDVALRGQGPVGPLTPAQEVTQRSFARGSISQQQDLLEKDRAEAQKRRDEEEARRQPQPVKFGSGRPLSFADLQSQGAGFGPASQFAGQTGSQITAAQQPKPGELPGQPTQAQLVNENVAAAGAQATIDWERQRPQAENEVLAEMGFTRDDVASDVDRGRRFKTAVDSKRNIFLAQAKLNALAQFGFGAQDQSAAAEREFWRSMIEDLKLQLSELEKEL